MEENSAPGCAAIEGVCLSEPLCGEGKCVPMIGGHRCVCPPQVAGNSCENGMYVRSEDISLMTVFQVIFSPTHSF